MTILCVDDEELVLSLTKTLCKELPEKPEVTCFSKSAPALEWLKENPCDICLLDINMPDMDGLTLAAKIKEMQPDTAIIFLTGYSEYAVKAFELHASGYLLKPVSKQRLAEEVTHAMSLQKPQPQDRIFVRTFGEFELYVDGKPVIFPRARSKELLAYLVDRQGATVSRAKAFSTLWEDVPYDRQKQKEFDVIIRVMKNALKACGAEDIFEMKSGLLRVCPEKFSCDFYRFLEGDVSAVNAYRGEYMSSYPWASFTEGYMGYKNGKEWR